MKLLTGLLVLAVGLAYPSFASATDGGGDNSTELPPNGMTMPAGISVLPSSYETDSTGFAIDTIRAGWSEGTIVYDRQSRAYLYADGQFSRSGALSSALLASTAGDLRTVYSDHKRFGHPCGKWAIACELIDEIVEVVDDIDFTGDPTDQVIDDTAAFCLASKQAVVQSINEQVGSCIASGGTADVDYGDQCGAGATLKCTFPISPEQPPEPPGT